MPEAVPAPLLSPALVSRLLFPAARACYGAALLFAPAWRWACLPARLPPAGSRGGPDSGRPPPGPAVLTLWRPRPAVLLAGAGIDACHAASMLALAVADPRMRIAGIADGATAAAFTAPCADRCHAGAASAAVSSARPPG